MLGIDPLDPAKATNDDVLLVIIFWGIDQKFAPIIDTVQYPRKFIPIEKQ